MPIMGVYIGLMYALFNGAAHFAVDFFVSKITKKLYENEDKYNFFTVIGADQFIHLSVLFTTFRYMIGM